jgi:hypothetical protein
MLFRGLRWLRVFAVGLVWLHLLAATSSAQDTRPPLGALNGRVVDALTAKAIANAVVSIPATSRTTRTDSSGRFALAGLTAGELVVMVAAVGYQPARATVVLADGESVELDVELERLALLGRVLTSASADAPRTMALREFEARRATGLGRFLTRTDLLANQGRSLDAVLLGRFAGLRVLTEGHMKVAASGRAGGRIRSAAPCWLNVIVDGVLRYQNIPGAELFDLRSLEASMIAGVELYSTATLPAEFNMGSNTACGALVIWLQH